MPKWKSRDAASGAVKLAWTIEPNSPGVNRPPLMLASGGGLDILALPSSNFLILMSPSGLFFGSPLTRSAKALAHLVKLTRPLNRNMSSVDGPARGHNLDANEGGES